MRSKLKTTIGTTGIVLLIAVCFMPAIAGAFGPGDGRQGRGFDGKGPHRNALGIWRNPKMVEELQLTDTQVDQIKEADFSAREKRLSLKAQLGSLELQMEKAISADTIDNAAVRTIAEQISDVRGDMYVQKVESRLALKEILNADQIDKLKQFARKKGMRGSERGQRGYERGQRGYTKHCIEGPAYSASSDNTEQ